MRTLPVFLILGAAVFAAPVPKALKKPSADGIWEWVEMNANGRSDDVSSDMRYWRIEGDQTSSGRATVKEVSRPMSELRPIRFRIDDPTQPALRTVIADGKTYSTVFELDGDTLRWAFSLDGPITECKPGLNVCYHVFQRVKE